MISYSAKLALSYQRIPVSHFPQYSPKSTYSASLPTPPVSLAYLIFRCALRPSIWQPLLPTEYWNGISHHCLIDVHFLPLLQTLVTSWYGYHCPLVLPPFRTPVIIHHLDTLDCRNRQVMEHQNASMHPSGPYSIISMIC